ncbi:MAG TPA: DUF488 domain-containing protein [Gemmataceae bacterium]|nr:DUF488 domain-containing protein [Gemmataceae bacterium]
MDAQRTKKQIRNALAADAVRLVSVGHSNHDWPGFVALVRRAGVTALADVRSSPYSGRYPHFNRESLACGLRDEEIAYVFLGDLLGGRPSQPSLYDDDGRVNYEQVRQSEAFQRGLEQLTHALEGNTVAFLCSEEDPLQCHRGLMIAPALSERGLPPHHLRKDGSLESNEQMERRLLRETGVGTGLFDGLFAATLTEEDRRFLLAEAYRCQARRKAYQLPLDSEME